MVPPETRQARTPFAHSAITDRKNCLVRMGGGGERISLSHEFSNQPDPERPAAAQESAGRKCGDHALVLSCISDPRLPRGFCGRKDSCEAPALEGVVCRKLAGFSSLCP